MSTARRAAIEVGLVLLAVALLIGVGYLLGIRHEVARANTYQTKSDQAEGAARAAADQASASDRQATHDQQAVTDADALAAAAKRELSRRLAALPHGAPASYSSPASPRANGAGRGNLPEIPDSPPLPSLPSAQDELTLTRAALAQAQAVIAAQGDQLAARDRLIASLTASRDAWKADAEASQKALALERIAAEARASAQAKRTFLGELKTGAVAALVGYVAGRAK